LKKIFKHIFNAFIYPDFEQSLNFRVSAIILFIILLVALFPTGKTIDFEYQEGIIWTYDDLIPSFSFPIFKNEEDYDKEVKNTIARLLPIYRNNLDAIKNNEDSISFYFNRIKDIQKLEAGLIYQRDTFRQSEKYNLEKIGEDSIKISKLLKELFIPLSDSEWVLFKSLLFEKKDGIIKTDTFQINRLRRAVILLNNSVLERGLLSAEKGKIKNDDIAVRKSNIEQVQKKIIFYDRNDLTKLISYSDISNISQKPEIKELLSKIALNLVKPNLVFDYEQTEKEKEIAIESVPKTLGLVKEGEKIISKYDKITAEIKTKIDSYRKAKVERMGNINIFLQYIGKFGHTFVILALFMIYIMLFRKKIANSNSHISLILVLFLIIAFLAYLTTQINTTHPVQYLIIVPVASMMLTILFDSRVGFYGTVTISLIISAIRGNDYSLFLTSIAGGTMAVYTVRDIKNRSQIFISILYILGGYSVCLISLGLERYDYPLNVMTEILYAAINAIFSPVLTFGVLIFFERVFRISTDLTLLELSDFNHPLLKELASKAPGTFHHSVVIGSLAEAAAEAVGGNPLLARVGAYYHDVGKIIKPEYFIENLAGGKNKHDKLTPNMSTLIIISHVKEGVDLAKKYKIPQRVLDFIPKHHGTTLVKYFYDKSLRKRNLKEEVREIDFRYPGPKPNSKETAIIMLADAVEAIVRSMPEPTVSKIEGVIADLIKERLLEGELDNCTLTIQDISKIKSGFLKVFVGIHHQRLKYPEDALGGDK
jgi:cyclic-di-AMP phosphodiesterase PgpH